MFRLSSGLSQTDLARDLGLSPQQIAQFEDGSARITALHLFQIARILNMPVTAFFDPDSETATPSRQVEMLWHFNTLPDRQQIALLNLTEAMATAGPRPPLSDTPTSLALMSETKGG